jgi:type I restriction enzyme S subunit
MFLEPRKLLKEYMYFFLQAKTAFFRNELAPGMGQPNLNTELLGDVAIPIPPIEDQRCIALLLSIWDKAVEKAERLIAAKERQYTAQARKFLFGGSLQSHNDLNRARWFSVPSHWKIVKIGSVAAEVKRTNSAGEDIPVLSCTKYNGLVDSLSYFGKQVFSLDTSAYKVVQNGEFAYATNHIEEGSIGYQNLYDKGLVSPMYTVFKTNLAIHDGYLFKVLKTETYRHIFQVNTSASVDRRGSLRWKEFARLPLPLPPIEEQKQISETLDIAQREIDLLKKQAEAYRRQKRGLMQKLLTGEWQINGGLDNHEPGTD